MQKPVPCSETAFFTAPSLLHSACANAQAVKFWLDAGRCVVKFDHHCLLINTTVGDKNHAKFLAYCVVEWYLIMWGWMLAWHAVQPCYNMLNLEAAVSLLQICKRSVCVHDMTATVLCKILLCASPCMHDVVQHKHALAVSTIFAAATASAAVAQACCRANKESAAW